MDKTHVNERCAETYTGLKHNTESSLKVSPLPEVTSSFLSHVKHVYPVRRTFLLHFPGYTEVIPRFPSVFSTLGWNKLRCFCRFFFASLHFFAVYHCCGLSIVTQYNSFVSIPFFSCPGVKSSLNFQKGMPRSWRCEMRTDTKKCMFFVVQDNSRFQRIIYFRWIIYLKIKKDWGEIPCTLLFFAWWICV